MLTKTSKTAASTAKVWLSKGASEFSKKLSYSEIQGSVAVATPNHHCDREAEGCCQCRPGKGEQHVLDHLDREILPRVMDPKTKSRQLS